MAMEAIEQETRDLLDPIKNAKDSDLFVDTRKQGRMYCTKFISALICEIGLKKIPNKITKAEKLLSSRGLGVQLPKYRGLSFKEKRKVNIHYKLHALTTTSARW